MARGGTDGFAADVVVIGAGVVGLACAAALARAGRSVTVLEKNARFGEECSARNSEVIHAGLYYEPGSLKGRFCVEGRERLYARAAAAGFAAHACGKLIVAVEPAEEAALEAIRARAAAQGVTELHRLTGAQARTMEPALGAHAALWSPRTGVLDSHGFMLSLLGEAEDHGAALALEAPVLSGVVEAGGVSLEIGGRAPTRLHARTVIVAAGLWSPQLAGRIEGLAPASLPPTVLTKGNYFALDGRAPFSRLIYPAPVPGGLGVHLTLDLAGRARFGPDVEVLGFDDPARIDYAVDPARGDSFYAAIRRYWPALPDGALSPAYSGVRPKIHLDYSTDFRIDGPEAHGAPGVLCLYGFESPALTGALAIGDHVAGLVAAMG